VRRPSGKAYAGIRKVNGAACVAAHAMSITQSRHILAMTIFNNILKLHELVTHYHPNYSFVFDSVQLLGTDRYSRNWNSGRS
jgi:hypothetical protein